MDSMMKVIFYFFMSILGISLADFAIRLQDQSIRDYQKGPISAGKFTRMMTGP